ncbi:MAG: hypothetical protein A2270_04450 [Elusimicrobia bacterium RIFOXYA12_FULL_51_18]|nr:MAG: hypothetical protein A2270_04450 [Elusimicrobia bacterium RIFOXYA12_FULL_51_18]OGS32827.1 MAG: hypothetical protein A2218_10505 [Elusimicrobia bacterium RIFOXYA2_FULL_53_38]
MFIFRWRRLVLFLGDAFLFYFSLALALTVRRWGFPHFDFFVQHARIFSLFIPIWAGTFYIVGLYDLRRINKTVNLINYALLAFAVNFAAVTVLFYIFSAQLVITPKTHLVLTLIFLHSFAALCRRVWTRFFLFKLLTQRVAFLGSNRLVEEIKGELAKNPHLGFTVVPLPDLALRQKNRDEYWLPRGKTGGELSAHVDLLVVDAEDAEKNPFQESAALSAAVMDEIPIITHLDFYEELYDKIPPEHAAKPSWLFSNVLHKSNSFYIVVKRGLDILAALFGLLLLSPVFAAAYLALKFSDGWDKPAFFFQKRIGYLGGKFIIWKFRTMVQGADKAGPLYEASADDSRITRVGRLLRLTRMDEIPQLWNILKGDMSLVGPRPEWIKEVRILELSIPHYHLRHLVKPGMSGWAQINFRATANKQDSLEKLHYDLYYVKNMTLALDIGIMMRTVRRIFQRDEAIGRP